MDFITLVERLGLPSAMVVVAMFGAYKFFQQATVNNQKSLDHGVEMANYVRDRLTELVSENTGAMRTNAEAVNRLEATLRTWATTRPCLLHGREPGLKAIVECAKARED